MGKMARLVDGIKATLRNKIKKKQDDEGAAPPYSACYDKVGKTESMRVEIRSRRAQQLIAKNLAAADSKRKTKKRFFAF
ncbi:uncharacterized protein LOC100846760 [Brachypodium distachyon]|uniref:Uncharacterized protein n=1 Tax=Brachypodium distachyon TaxID=15368 RepID=I1IPU9_BRADI|nr:uncharacterized protein LOC100846760 [Brachypodium distachyon]KQJ90102.1 hypothetical protein BRADI_4g29417v3 [Brachypodium distachyon]|eukprot:XP_003578063.1 uncharacterized protein LOC100846760 [Brachypodium distachyon]